MQTPENRTNIQQSLTGEYSFSKPPSTLVQTHRTMPLKYLSQFFEHTCDLQPEKTAVICGSSQLTYLELDRRANRLARLLISRGIAEGKPVGILLERSLNIYIALLGVLKAGAVLVPLDASFPPDRVAFIAEDAELQDLVTTSAFYEKTSALPCPVLELDQNIDALTIQSETRVEKNIDPLSPCYIIYTSGSTGRPKGVVVSHISITNYLHMVMPAFAVRSDDRVYQGMSIAFDGSFEELWLPWITGATLVAGPTDARRLGHGLADFLVEHDITVLTCVPALLTTVDHDIPSLRTLILGGEVCPPDLVRRWFRPGRRIFNTYGPTETTITATCCELFPDRPITIGTPQPTYHVYIFDNQLRPVEEGETGEICIGGCGVAIGYLNRPDLIRDRFVPNPIRSDCTDAPRIYRTGDLGRFTPGGDIEYLGRVDTQVKFRGYRIELGEIEEILRKDQAVENAVVKPLEKEGIVQDLVAYVKLHGRNEEAEDPDLRQRLYTSLQHRLPTYMIPSFIEILNDFPLQATTKLDRAALPPPASPRIGGRCVPHVSPTTPLECLLASVWEQILGCEHVSVEDDFFCDLGGHSLVAALVTSRLRQEPEMQALSIGDLYAHPTIRSLAKFIQTDLAHSENNRPIAEDVPVPRRYSSLRILACGIAQLVALYGMILLLSIPVVGLYTAEDSILTLALLAGATVVAWLSIRSLLLPVVVGRLLMTGVRPGCYPLWGATYLRWWLYGKILMLSPLGLLSGSPLLPSYLRLLGARVGRNCHLASQFISLPMLIDIGEGVSIGYAVRLQPFTVKNGWLRIAPIRIGDQTFVGTHSFVLAGAQIGSEASVAEQSLVQEDAVIPAREHWGGSPIKRLDSASPLLEAMTARAEDSRNWPFSVLVGFVAGVMLFTFLPWLLMIPSVVLLSEVTDRAGLAWGMASTALSGPLFVLVTIAFVLIGKGIVIPVVHPGIYRLRSWFGFRQWFKDQMIGLSLDLTNTLYGTLYLIPFLRLLGARVGRWSEVSTVTYINPDMLILGDGCLVADIAVLGPAVFHRGYIALAPVELGRRSFVGNGALVPGSTHLGDNSLIGVHSVSPVQQVNPDTSWLGSPAIFLPRRQASQHFGEETTYRPRPSLVAKRLTIEYFRVTLPATILGLVFLVAVYSAFQLAAVLPLLMFLILLPLLVMGSGIASALVVILLKWLIIGRYRPRVEPLWSMFIWRDELITGLYETVAVPMLLEWLTGTPWIAPFLRLLGTRIGRRVWFNTTYLAEFDLTEVEDDAAIGNATCLQTHLFEDRVMKMSTVRIGAASSLDSGSVVLYGTKIGAGASLDALSLVMKGEILPAESHWRGIPACAG